MTTHDRRPNQRLFDNRSFYSVTALREFDSVAAGLRGSAHQPGAGGAYSRVFSITAECNEARRGSVKAPFAFRSR